MTSTDYIITAVLVLLVIPQLRGMRIGLRSLLLPLVAVGAAAAYYLKAVPTAGHDVALDLALGAVGLALGLLCGLATRVTRDAEGFLFSKATAIAALLWIVGMAARTGFVYYAEHSGAQAVYNFSRTNQITGQDAWTAALVLMALVQVLARLVVIRVRAHSVGRTPVASAVAA
jgi:hypothetical protein